MQKIAMAAFSAAVEESRILKIRNELADFTRYSED